MRTRYLVLGFVLGVAAAVSAVAVAAQRSTTPVRYVPADGGSFTGVRPTAVGLPQTGATATIGAKELPVELKRYRDSGLYGRDLAAVAGSARRHVAKRLREQRSSRRSLKFDGRPAVVLDIDETSLSNYAGIVSSGFSASGSVGPIASGTGTAIAPVLALSRWATSRKVAVFFVTGRPEALSGVTAANLRRAGYSGWRGLQFKPSGTTTERYKAGARAAIEKRGYDIVANVGDQESDLDGGYAERAFKLPNPFYFIPD